MVCSMIELYVDLCYMHTKTNSCLVKYLIDKPDMYETIK